MGSEYASVSNSADASEKQLERMRTQMYCTQVKVTLELMIGSSHSKIKDRFGDRRVAERNGPYLGRPT